MIQEIQQLACALIKTESRMQKTHAEKSQATKKLKGIIHEQEQCMALMQEKISRLEARNAKLVKKEEKLTTNLKLEEEHIGQEFSEKDRKIHELTKRIKGIDATHQDEKRDIIINMERDLQDQTTKMHKKYEVKVNTLKSINDQLNVKL